MTHLRFASIVALVLTVGAIAARGQPAFAPAKAVPPDPAVLKQIAAKTAELRAAFDALPKRKSTDVPVDVLADVEVYLKATEWIARHGEWFTKDSPKQTLAVLDAGLARAKAAREGKTPWRDVRNKPIVRGYYSDVDGSVQPYSVTLPDGYGTGGKKWRLDVVLHGRDQTLTEVKFINGKEAAKSAAKGNEFVVLEPYGRGNNAYRWAGEADVLEAVQAFVRNKQDTSDTKPSPIDGERIVLRGFSMGGAGTWHLGLHYPFAFAVIGPGAGFTNTRGYIKNLPEKLPDYQEKCLHIYDAVDYAENAFDVPVVAYSGSKDPQKAAADNIENALKGFPLPLRFTHLVAPGLEHKMPPEWQAKAEAEYAKYVRGRGVPERVRFVTYTVRYNQFGHGEIEALGEHYRKAVVDSTWTKDALDVKTENVRALKFISATGSGGHPVPAHLTIDGQRVAVPTEPRNHGFVLLVNTSGKWAASEQAGIPTEGVKHGVPFGFRTCQGPIDDAFTNRFLVVPPNAGGWHPVVTAHANASLDRFAAEWDKFFRGKFPTRRYEAAPDYLPSANLVLFGDPGNNPLLAKVVAKLPIIWTKDRLVVNGFAYDPRSHVPVLISPNPLTRSGYVVINSGHTFHAAELQGTNAQLYPRLGDWAVLKPTPTAKDPAAAEVVDAGLFDENWQFVKTAESRSLVAPGSKLEKLWGEGEFTEGPTPGPDGAIYFSDIGNRILRFDPKAGKTTVFRDPSGRSNGLKFDARGRLVACEGANTGGNRRVSVTEADGTVKTLADKYQGKRFNSPNDLTLDAKGRVYFTDPRYVGDEPRELDADSVYRIDPDGTVSRVVHDVTKPNGIALSPDGKTLYLAENNGDPKQGPRQLLAYPLNADGTVGAKKVLHDFGDDRGIDGMAVTADGRIAATAGKGPTAGVHFFAPNGTKVGFVPTPEAPSNCCFAGPGSKTLYITAGKSLYRVELTMNGK